VQQQSLPVTEARIIAAATPPLKKSSPRVTLILLLSALAGSLLGVGSAIGSEYFDRTVRRPEQIEQDLGRRCLGLLNRFGNRAVPRSAAAVSSTKPARHKHRKASDTASRVAHWLAGAAGETLRATKCAIDENVQPAGARVIAVISPNVGEGKTTIALSLALLAARCGKRTLLIDANLRKPTLTRTLAPDAQGGFAVAMTQPVPVVDSSIRHELGFHFIGQAPGFAASHPAELFSSDAMHKMVEQFRARYDYVIVDTPALLPYSDVVAAANHFDAFVLVAEWGRTRIEDINRSLSSSGAIFERLVGVLINKATHGDRG
jgi:polysaccharide biosynthesis transport protein